MHAAPRAHPVGETGPAVTASAVPIDPVAGYTGPVLGGQPASAPAARQPAATVPAPGPGDRGLPPSLARLLKTAQQEIDRHVNDHGRCAACDSAFPCNRASLADLALSAIYGANPGS